MMDHDARRRLTYSAVTILEPYASSRLIQHYLARRHKLVFPLLRIYVDLERLVRTGDLVRHVKARLGGTGTTFFYETLGLALVEPEHGPPPRVLTAAAPPDLLDRLGFDGSTRIDPARLARRVVAMLPSGSRP